MSLEVVNLTKVYGAQKAIEDVSFTLRKGEIAGFLGPNGAGKSTTMKIATGYVPPSQGQVRVNGMDVVRQRQQVKQTIGYLPEHNPLYTDMYVHEYLEFSGRLYGLKGASLRQRIAEMIELCGLPREQNKKIESLSKGYRQRVGLAQALLHDPSVLILDEPTTGLDPNQIFEIRKLIKEVSRNKTVIFSSHIMQEVQALCDRVIVINRGKIVADDLLARVLQRGQAVQTLLVEWASAVAVKDLESLNGVASVSENAPGAYVIVSQPGSDARQPIMQFTQAHGLTLLSLRQEENSLESVFKQLTRVEA
ncbi:MAG: gliding motility-associated ABC transporter ATP-binding subunit GldA [Cyclobacteriaceae bacterium]|jgi:ABC-2 type transport system ATP-binding protein|nr:gliding motility-associated ABC transporter ATP-binding subunit GldA [Cyclobacteriaceae bacterium]